MPVSILCVPAFRCFAGNRVFTLGDKCLILQLGGGVVPDVLLADLAGDGRTGVLPGPDDGLWEDSSRESLAWPPDSGALEDRHWYLRFICSPCTRCGDESGPEVRERLAGWGQQVFGSILGDPEGGFAAYCSLLVNVNAHSLLLSALLAPQKSPDSTTTLGGRVEILGIWPGSAHIESLI